MPGLQAAFRSLYQRSLDAARGARLFGEGQAGRGRTPEPGAESGRDHAKVRDGYFQHNREFAADTYITCFA